MTGLRLPGLAAVCAVVLAGCATDDGYTAEPPDDPDHVCDAVEVAHAYPDCGWWDGRDWHRFPWVTPGVGGTPPPGVTPGPPVTAQATPPQGGVSP